MAARRLVMVLLVMLIVSTFAATLVPPPDEEGDETSTSTTSTTSATGKLVRATISADAKRPERVPLELGNDLELRVTAKRFHEVEIPSLGEFDEVDQFAPAVFDLLPDDPGTYPVRVVEGGDVIARIVVGSPKGQPRQGPSHPGD